MKKLGIIIFIICLVMTVVSVVGIITANSGKVESLEKSQFDALMKISAMPFPTEAPSEAELVEHAKSDSFVQLAKKMQNTTLSGRLRVLVGMAEKYEALEARLTEEKALDTLEETYMTDLKGYGIYGNVTNLTLWEKFCLFSMVYRSVLLIVGFLGMGLGLAIFSSGNAKSDLD